jgi:hypothetical protein
MIKLSSETCWLQAESSNSISEDKGIRSHSCKLSYMGRVVADVKGLQVIICN